MNIFFLKADCLNPPKIWRECKVLSEHYITETGTKLYLAEVSPPFESDYLKIKRFDHVLIGMISPKWDLDRIGEPNFMVDIMYATDGYDTSSINASALKQLGMGIISTAKE